MKVKIGHVLFVKGLMENVLLIKDMIVKDIFMKYMLENAFSDIQNRKCVFYDRHFGKSSFK